VVRVSARRTLPVSREEGFDYITNVRNWHSYWPALLDVPKTEGASWTQPGDETTVVLRIRGKPVQMLLHLDEYRPYEFVGYHSTQAGLPDLHHERIFRDSDGLLDYELAIEFKPRGGIHGLLDRTIVARIARKNLLTTLDNLQLVFTTSAATEI
jgi:polyketide cyclase/dehydrase/lipid transport protein